MNVKESTRDTLLKLYKSRGLNTTIAVARGLLTYDFDSDTDKRSVNGEICETVLEMLILDLIRVKPKLRNSWYYTKSMILKDIQSNGKDFLTELDITLFTPECIYLFECKSYSGDKSLVDRGTLISAGGLKCDVYAQNSVHLKMLDKNLKSFSSKPTYKMVLFNFSKGVLVDNRSDKYKVVMPCVNEKTWTTILLPKDSKKVWDYGNLLEGVRIIERASDRLRSQHLKYVKERYGNE